MSVKMAGTAADRGKSAERPITRKVNENVPVTRFTAEAMNIPPYEG